MISIRYLPHSSISSIPVKFKANPIEPSSTVTEAGSDTTPAPPEEQLVWFDNLVNWVSQNSFCQFLHQKVFPKSLYPAWLYFLDRLEIGSTLAGRRAPRFLFFGKDRNTVFYPTPEETEKDPDATKKWRIEVAQEDERYLISNTFSMCFWFIFGTQALVEATKSLSDPDPLYPPQPVKLSKLDRFFLKHAFNIDPDTLPQPEETPSTEAPPAS